jgi:hypothetical protein
MSMWIRLIWCGLCFSSMSNSLSSMAAAGSCLQQREHSSYPYKFHDPLHSLSSTYNHSAARAAVSNPAVAHSQSAINTHASYGGVTTSSTPATGTGKSRIRLTWASVAIGPRWRKKLNLEVSWVENFDHYKVCCIWRHVASVGFLSTT